MEFVLVPKSVILKTLDGVMTADPRCLCRRLAELFADNCS